MALVVNVVEESMSDLAGLLPCKYTLEYHDAVAQTLTLQHADTG